MLIPKSVYIAFEAFPRPKGASSHILSMIMAMAEKNAPVLFLCLGFGDMPSWQQEGDIIIRRFKGYHPNMLKRSEGFSAFVYDSLKSFGSGIRLCVFRDPWGGAAAISADVCKNTIFEVNALPSWELDYTYTGFSENFVLKEKIEQMEYYCLANSKKITTVSSITAKALMRKGLPRNKISVIPNSAPDFFQNPVNDSPVPEFLKMGRWVGYFGSLHSWQGVEEGVMAFALICRAYEDVSLVIVTGGRKEAKKSLRKLVRKLDIEDRVLIHPPLVPEHLAVIVRGLEFTIAPLKDTPRNTQQGCCPVKIIESMAAGVPVIASDLACVRSTIKHNENGILIKTGDRRALALAMERCLNNTNETERLGENASELIKARFNRSHIHKLLNQCFDNQKNRSRL